MQKWVPEALVAPAILENLVTTFGDVERIERAIAAAIPDHGKVTALRQEYEGHKQRLADTDKESKAIVRLASKGLLTDEEIEHQMTEIRDKKAALENRMADIDSQTTDLPTAQQVRKRASSALRVLAHVTQDPDAIKHMSHTQRRKLAEAVFGGKDATGGRLGVFVSQTDDEKRPWKFEIRGMLGNLKHNVPDVFYEPEGEKDPEDGGEQSSLPCTAVNLLSPGFLSDILRFEV